MVREILENFELVLTFFFADLYICFPTGVPQQQVYHQQQQPVQYQQVPVQQQQQQQQGGQIVYQVPPAGYQQQQGHIPHYQETPQAGANVLHDASRLHDKEHIKVRFS